MELVRVVGGAVLASDRVLVARRGPGQRDSGLWEFPGGKVEAGESDAEALARELDEELGLRVEVGRELGRSAADGRILLILLACRLSSAQEPHLREHSETRWVDAAGLAGLTWAPADVPLLPAVAAALG